jgi:CubicO group peptidase (beta-lactamase class C family)
MGGIWTTVADLDRWVRWLDDAFPARHEPDDGPLCRASRREMQTPQRWSGMRTLRDVRAPTSYGFGLRVLHEPELGTVITHSGGLPGYGSNMRWLSGRRIGAIALGNTTYAPMTDLTARMLDEVAAQGLVPPHETPVTELIEDTAHRLVALLNDWTDATALALLTNSLVQDESLDRLRAAAERVTAVTGAIAISSIEAPTATQATIRCIGELGPAASVAFFLAPPSPPRIQSYSVEVDPASEPDG